MTVKDIFAEPISDKPPPATMKVEAQHPVPRKGIAARAPLPTNKFFSNFFLGDQSAPTFTFPYSIWWASGRGIPGSYGMAISHTEAGQRVFGEAKFNDAASYFFNPVGIQSMVVSATELGNRTKLTMDEVTAFSTRVSLAPDGNSAPAVSFPLVQGMAFITAQYNGTTPLIQSGVFFKTVTKVTAEPKPGVTKFNFRLEDGTLWHMYAWTTNGEEFNMQVVNNGSAVALRPFHGMIQVCKDPGSPGSEQLLDDGAGIYPVTVQLTGSVSQALGTYRFTFVKEGHQMGNLYMFALPHHVESFDNATRRQVQHSQLQTTTKGVATLTRGTIWAMTEPHMPVNMGFAPWSLAKGSVQTLSDRSKELIRETAARELSQNMTVQTGLDSMYFSGKALAKFALILYVVKDMLGDDRLLQSGLSQLRASFAVFASNRQKYALWYETAWGGIVSSASYVTGDPGVDFGNTYYNDHHFHYGYHILAAAVIGHLDPAWLKENTDYVNALVRDVSNPSAKDGFFPPWRSFDWYHGHSWAHGLYAAMDGKDQESSSEDLMHVYAIKMWGNVTGDAAMEARGNLQLAVMARSLQHYYLYRQDNQIQPPQFIGNKVAGILFENKIDHTTYFDPHVEAIQGIHMIPILASTPLARSREFVKEEWETYFSNGRAEGVDNAWKSILVGNYATVEPRKAWEVFSRAGFQPRWLDGGVSLTWLLAYSAALGGL